MRVRFLQSLCINLLFHKRSESRQGHLASEPLTSVAQRAGPGADIIGHFSSILFMLWKIPVGCLPPQSVATTAGSAANSPLAARMGSVSAVTALS